MPYGGHMPRDTLTRGQIVNAAIDLLDADGLEGLNMRALGQRLGSAATAVYWHVGSKDNLIALAADEVWSEIARPDPAVVGWRAAAAAGYGASPEDSFESGLQAILDGLQAKLASRR